MQLDDAQKLLLKKLVQTIHDTVMDSEDIAKAVYEIRAAGVDVDLHLDGTINISTWPEGAVNIQGHRFLKSMHVRVGLGDATPE